MTGPRKEYPGEYNYTPEDVEWFQYFDVTPKNYEEVRDELDNGNTVEIIDIPAYLDRKLAAEVQPAIVQYRLTQLFGTPNLDRLQAGHDNQTERDEMTWCYLFDVEFNPPNEESKSFILAVYDYRTDVSTGFARFIDEDETAVKNPRRDAPDGYEMPDDEFLVGLVQLVLNLVDHPVQATYKDLWV